MAEGMQTVYRQFVTGPAQRPSHERRAMFYPALGDIAGGTEALKDFMRRAAAGGPLHKIAEVFAPRAETAAPVIGEAAVAAKHPRVTTALRLLDAGRPDEAAAALREGRAEVEALADDVEHLHGALLAYVASARTSPVGEYALRLMKLLWVWARLKATADGDELPPSTLAFITEFWRVGTPSIAVRLPRSADDAWAAVGPAAARAKAAKSTGATATGAAGPKPEALVAARDEVDFLHRLQSLTAAPATPSEAPSPVPPEVTERRPETAATDQKRVSKERESDVAPANAPKLASSTAGLSAASLGRLSASARAVIEDLGFDPEVHAAPTMLAGIDAAMARHGGDLQVGPSRDTVALFGLLVEIDGEVFGDPMCDEGPPPCHCDLLVDLDAKHGAASRIHVLGSGRAYRIDQTHERYLPGQLVHTENHEEGAQRGMTFRRLERSEQTDETESESETFREAETTTHDQFETAKEIAAAAQQQNETSMGLSTTASYGSAGMSASLAGHYDTTSATASQTSEKIATRSAQEVINKAIERVKQKNRSRRVVSRLLETERTETLSIDNTGGPSRTDFYRAIDQEYRNQLVSVGERLMVRLTLQEPMAYLLYALARRAGAGVVIPKPVKPDIVSFDQINPGNFGALAGSYGAAVRPPPAPQTVSHHVNHPFSEGEPPWLDTSGTIDIPAGWQAASVTVNMLRGSGGGTYITVGVGTGTWTFSAGGSAQWGLSGEQLKLAYAVRAHDNEYAATLVVSCTPTLEAVRKWQIETFDAIMEAYRAKQDAYDAQIAAAQFGGGPGDERNPATNRVLIEQELQKFVLGATYPPLYFRGFDSMKFARDCDAKDGLPVPEPDFIDAWGETPWMTFLSQIYEWKNMTYQFQPYSYGRRSHWRLLRGRTSTDPFFENAMTAGAIIIDVPVAPHMTEAFLYFLDTGQIWSGGDMPLIGEPGYQDLAIAIRDSEILDGTPVGDPWFTTVPTSMVYIDDRPDAL
jgi:hypothetical protein